MPSTEEFTFESLWDDYEKRTWHYAYAKDTLGASNPRLLNWIGSIDHSGYTREKCLRDLITNRKPGDENRILLRLTDWVPQIQSLARDWVLATFRSLSFDAITANQRLILYISRKDRVRDDPAMREIESDLLRRSSAISPSQFFGLYTIFRRYLFSLSFASDQQLRPLILDDPDPFNRLLLLTCFPFTSITDDEKQRLAADKSAFLRRRLFLTQLESGLPPDRDQLIALALDSTRSLRELGQFHLKSFWTFVDEGLSVLLTDPGPTLRETVVRAIHGKTSIYESLSPKHRKSISSKISRLKNRDQKRYGKMTDLLEFTMKSAS